MASRDIAAFDKLVDELVLNATTSGIHLFGELSKNLPGVYPSDVLAALRRLAVRGAVEERLYDEALTSTQGKPVRAYAARHLGIAATLPLPHPLDFDWRYTADTADYVIRTCVDLSGPRDRVAFLGAPTTFVIAHQSNIDRDTILLDKNAALLSCARALFPDARTLQCDLLIDRVPDIDATVVVIDPPWYPEHFEAFMWAASQLCDLRGHVLVSLPAVGTRPGVLDEREKILRWSAQLGFGLEKYEEAALRYVSPPFEQNALRAEGLCDILVDWRCADLAILRKELLYNIERPSGLLDREVWTNVAIDGIQWRIRESGLLGFHSPELIGLLPGDVLTSVSRRAVLRHQADVWTTGNRIFSCIGTNVLRVVVEAIDSGDPLYESAANFLGVVLKRREKALIGKAARKVEDVMNLERAEADLYLR